MPAVPCPSVLLEQAIAPVARRLFGEAAPAPPFVRPTQDPRHGDFQVNLAMVQAKAARANPRELAARVVAEFGESKEFEPPEIAGPGFINFRLRPQFVRAQVVARAADDRLGIPKPEAAETVVLDYSGPNIAKEMHVGHLRSTLLGDALARLHEFLGRRVVRDNHLGDWGTQFGMVILGYKRHGSEEALRDDPFDHMEGLYRRIQAEAKEDPATQAAAREELLNLQQGDAENLALWKKFVAFSREAIDRIYERLGVRFDETLGESFYNDRLETVVDDLVRRGIARPSEGATVVFFEDVPALADHPFLIRKSDGAFLYSTTDLATLAYRIERWNPARIIYVTDGRQQMHFQQLFATARKWGKADPPQLEHVWFGAILGENKKPLKTREGAPIKLKALLDEAEQRAAAILEEKESGLSPEERRHVAQVVGIGALKYADLGQNRNLDYVFSWDKLLAFDGNTAPYLQNAYVRIRSIFRKAGLNGPPGPESLAWSHEAELGLAKRLLGFEDVIRLAAAESRPHHLCTYLYELAGAFHGFYEACPVVFDPATKQDVPAPLRDSRLVLCDLTARTIQKGLGLLGIATVERM